MPVGMGLTVGGNLASQGLWEYLGAGASPLSPSSHQQGLRGQAWLPFSSPPPQQEGTRRFQDRSLGCIWKPWQRGFKFGPIPVSRESTIWILFAVPWQGSLSRTVERGQGGGGSLCGQGPSWGDSRPCSRALGPATYLLDDLRPLTAPPQSWFSRL